MRRVIVAIVLAGSLALGGCAQLDKSKKYTLTGVGLGAGLGAAVGASMGEPWGGAMIGALVGGAAGLLYDDLWQDEVEGTSDQQQVPH
jgi:hypothetical protein